MNLELTNRRRLEIFKNGACRAPYHNPGFSCVLPTMVLFIFYSFEFRTLLIGFEPDENGFLFLDDILLHDHFKKFTQEDIKR